MPSVGPNAAELVGHRIRGLRTDRLRVTQGDLQAMSGIDVVQIRRIEAGKTLPTVGALVRLAFALGVDPGELIRGIRPADLSDRIPVLSPSDLVAERRKA